MLKNFKKLSSFLILITLVGCADFANSKKSAIQNQNPSKEKICMDKVIAIDAELGKIRNHNCEKISLTETILIYVDHLKKIDFSDCPEDFAKAFKSHQDAWLEMIEVTKSYQSLRGEMHDLFDIMEKGKHKDLFKKRLDAIWKTWADIEEAMKNK